MFNTIQQILKEKRAYAHQNEGVMIATVTDASDGVSLAKDILYGIVDKKTALYLSGGSTPKVLYQQLAKEEKLIPGAVGMVDERYGRKFHEKSNEKMIIETDLIRYFKVRDIPFYPIILGDQDREKAAMRYDEQVRSLNAVFPRSVAILGVGTDGHTSTIAPNRKDFHNPFFDPEQRHLLVSTFYDETGKYGERVGMTFLGLSMQDVLLVLAFGQDKREALQSVFTSGSEEEIPGRFFTRPDIAKKTLFITDQNL
jgi:6-phosphogluconolactonase/glucosamine-6-phosphate isomerase/deaminase